MNNLPQPSLFTGKPARRLVFPFQRTLLYDVDESAKEEGHEHEYCPKTSPTKPFKIYRIRIEKDHFHIKQHKQNSYQEILDRHRLAGISMALDTTGKVLQLVRRFSAGTQEVGYEHQETN